MTSEAKAGEARGAVPAQVLVLMGVSGSGKTTVGALLAGRLGWRAAEADDFHPPQNIAKMKSGVPLDDADRLPWLEAIAAQIDRWRSEGKRGVITCSALKRRYRDVLIGERRDVRLIYLKGEEALISRRIATRHEHFMPQSLLHSQFEALEEPGPDEDPITVSVAPAPRKIVARIVSSLDLSADTTRRASVLDRE